MFFWRISFILKNVGRQFIRRELSFDPFLPTVSISKSLFTMDSNNSCLKKRVGAFVTQCCCCLFPFCQHGNKRSKRSSEDEQNYQREINDERSKLLSSSHSSEDLSVSGGRLVAQKLNQSIEIVCNDDNKDSLLNSSSSDDGKDGLAAHGSGRGSHFEDVLKTSPDPPPNSTSSSFLVDLTPAEVSNSTKEENEISIVPSDKNKPKRKNLVRRRKPNYFVGVKVNSTELKKSLKEVQDCVLNNESRLSPALVQLSKLHVTLLVLAIENEQQLEKAEQALKSSCDLLMKDVMKTPLEMNVSGLSHFNHKVLFAELTQGQAKTRFLNLAENVMQTFESFGFDVREKEFNPHLTLFKLSQAPKLHKMGIRKIQSSTYEEFCDKNFGDFQVSGIQLLSMEKEKDEHGYYFCHQECLFENT